MNGIDYLLMGILIGYYAYPIISVFKTVFKNAYDATYGDKSKGGS